MSAYTKNSLLPSTSSVSSSSTNHQYKHYSSISTTKSSPIDKYTNSVGSSNGKSEMSKEMTSLKKNGDHDDITLYKPISYTTSSMTAGTSSSSSSSTSTDAKKTELSSSSAGTTSTTVITNGKHKITNNFKLPPFPVYVPPTDLPMHLTSSTSSLAGLSSKNEPTSTAFSGTSKYSDSYTSSTTSASTTSSSYSTTLGRLSNVSSSRTITNSANTPNTNTLPLHLGRTNPYLYQSDSNNFNNATATSSISPATTTSSSTLYSSQSNYNNIYSTLPKTTGSSSSSYTSKFDTTRDNNTSGAGTSSYPYNSYSTDYYSNLATTNNNTSSNTSTYTSSNVSENIYRVQYSATNPFLDPIDTNVTTQTASDNISSIFTATRNGNSGSSSMSVSEIARKFEKLDSEEDLK